MYDNYHIQLSIDIKYIIFAEQKTKITFRVHLIISEKDALKVHSTEL